MSALQRGLRLNHTCHTRPLFFPVSARLPLIFSYRFMPYTNMCDSSLPWSFCHQRHQQLPFEVLQTSANTFWFTALRLRLPTQNRIQHKLSIHAGSPFDSTLWRIRCTADVSATSAETPCLKHWLQIIEPTPGFVNSNDHEKTDKLWSNQQGTDAMLLCIGAIEGKANVECTMTSKPRKS